MTQSDELDKIPWTRYTAGLGLVGSFLPSLKPWGILCSSRMYSSWVSTRWTSTGYPWCCTNSGWWRMKSIRISVVKLNKVYLNWIHLLIIMKTPLIYHLKQTSWQSMHKWRSFTTSKFTPKVSGQKFFWVH